MRGSLATSLHLDHGTLSLDQRPGDQPPMQRFVPMGLLSLKAMVDQSEVEADLRVVELNGLLNTGRIRNDERLYGNIVDKILEEGDDFVGLMTDADSFPHTILVAREVKRRAPETHLCLGGPASSPISTLVLERFPFIDSVARGEAELTLVELLAAIGERRPPTDVLGLTWRDCDRVTLNPERPLIDDLDTLPIPAFDAYDMSSHAPMYLDVGRGCPFKCSFCATAPFWRRQFRMKSIDRIIQELILVRDRYDYRHVNLSHDIFTANRRWTMEFCERMAEENLGITWTCSTRTDIINREVLVLMAKAGCVEIYYGIEAGATETQAAISKGLDLNYSREIVKATVDVGIRPITGFIIGHPTETMETLQETLDRFFEFLEIGKARAHLFTLCPFPGAPMFQTHQQTIARPAQYAELPLMPELAADFDTLKDAHRDIFANTFRYATPWINDILVDASEELSCHLVVLKSIWSVLLPLYDSSLDWYQRWTRWIEAHNARFRPASSLRHQGNAYDLLRFVGEELERMGLEDSDIAALARYEELKLDARLLAEPSIGRERCRDGLTADTIVRRRCEHLEERFRHDLGALLAGRRSDRLPDDQEIWVLFAKTEPSMVDTLVVDQTIVRLLEAVDRPRPIAELGNWVWFHEGRPPAAVFPMIEQLVDRGLLTEVVS